jgi:Asp-tRNA(Asn)/Glu-tRNA(Gln) amidotransferase C subunit
MDRIQEYEKKIENLITTLDEIIRMVESSYATPDAMDDPIWKVAREAIAKAKAEGGE